MNLYLKYGHINDEELENLDYHMDKDSNGNQGRQNADLTQELRQG